MDKYIYNVLIMVEVEAADKDSADNTLIKDLQKFSRKNRILESNIDYIQNSAQEKIVYISVHDNCIVERVHKERDCVKVTV